MSTQTIEGRLVDIRRGRARRSWLLLVPYTLCGALLWFGAGYASVIGMSIVGIMLLAIPRLWELAHRGRGKVHIEPGRVRIGGIVLRARDVIGASTALAEDGVLVTIKARGAEPVSLVVPSESDAHELLAALGVGHTGAGRLEWIVLKRSFSMFLAVFEWLLGILMALALVQAVFRHPSAVVYALLSFLVMAVAAILRTQWTANAQSVAFDPWGVWVSGHQLPWASIQDATDHPEGIQLAHDGGTVVARIPSDSMRQTEKDVVLEQIRAGIGRAHGLGTPKREPHTRIDILARGADAIRQWLARVDTIANGIGKRGYRETSLEVADLWLTLEDPEAPADLRAAAARVLGRTHSSARVRIDAAIAAVRDPRQGKGIRIAMESDVEEAAVQLEQLERN